MAYANARSQLEALFGPIGEASPCKEVPTLHSSCHAWIEQSPFAVPATVGPPWPGHLASR